MSKDNQTLQICCFSFPIYLHIMYCLRLLQNQHHILQISKIYRYIKYNISINPSNENINTVNNLKIVQPADIK